MAPPAIHQFSIATADGDGITNAMLFTQRLLRELGFVSEIFAGSVDPALRGHVKPMAAYPDDPGDILLVHHSMGHLHGSWLARLKSRRVLVYHNITPPELLPPRGRLRHDARLGRRQLGEWRTMFEAAVAVSPYNARELTERGYGEPHIVPLLVDLDRIRKVAPDPDVLAARRANPAFKILFVGRVVPHKQQDKLIDALAHLRPRLDRPVRLMCPGHAGDDAYVERLRRKVAELGLAGTVDVPGPVDEPRLAAEYRGCDAFCSLSAHEGFGMPLIEAMAADLPVVAANAGAVRDTLGEGGLCLREADPAAAADALQVLASDPGLRRRVLQGQRRNLERFERAAVVDGLCDVLKTLGVPAGAPTPPASGPPAGVDLRLEGPFDSSYSLAIVNRELAKALDQQGERVALRHMNRAQDATPDPAFLRRDAQAARLHARDEPNAPAAAVLRNCYPPDTSAMPEPTRIMANHAWEESGVPAARVAAFNRDVNLITTPSRFVAKVLRDNGVRTPIAAVGNGVDHLVGVTPVRPGEDLGAAAFTFLHVSTGYARKGVDALLEAWGRTFTTADDVALVLKTFPDRLSTVPRDLERLAASYPDHAPVRVIDRDLDDGELAGLYDAADAFVAPTRGEGFGMPIAEAALFDLPVVTTGHGGHMDVCSPETAWLVDYRFAPAENHLGIRDSVWADPDVADLARQMDAVRRADGRRVAAATAALRQRVLAGYTWDAVAARTREAIAALDALPVPDVPPHVAWVTTWNARCGIAEYAANLSCRLPAGAMTVLANHTTDSLGPDGENVVRCWDQGWHDDLYTLETEIRRRGVHAAVIQFNFGFYDLHAFGGLLERLHADGIRTFVILHATADADRPDGRVSLRAIPRALAGATRLFVHGVADLNRLKDFGHVDNVAVLPHGVRAAPTSAASGDERERFGLGRGRIVASFGFLLPHKGLLELVEAFERLRDAQPDLQLLLLNARYPVPDSDDSLAALSARIRDSRHADAITLVTDFLPEDTALALLGLAEVVVFPYQHSRESASGAVHTGIASGRPVAITPLEIFADVAPAVERLPGTDPAAIADGLRTLLADPDRRARITAAQTAWLEGRQWEMLSERLWNILMAETRPWPDALAQAPASGGAVAEAAQ